MKIDNKKKYEVSGALLNKLLFDARESTLRQIELADIRLVKNSSIPRSTAGYKQQINKTTNEEIKSADTGSPCLS